MAGKNDTIDIGGLRKSGLLISVVLALVAWSFLWQDRSGGFFFTLSAFFLLSLSLFKPLLLKAPHLVWVRIAYVPGQLLKKILLILLFFLVITPIGLLVRLLKIDLLAIKMPKDGWSYWDRGPDSYWIPKKQSRTGIERYGKQY